MAEVFRERGCEVTQAGIEFTEPRYLDRFSVFPFRHAVFDIVPLLIPQLRQKTGQIKIPEAAQTGDYDLICFGSPTWFFRTAMPLRSYLESDEAGKILAGKPFAAYVVCRSYWSVNLHEVERRGSARAATSSTASASPTKAARSAHCFRCSATSARARCANGHSGSRSRRPTSSPTLASRPGYSPTSWRTMWPPTPAASS